MDFNFMRIIALCLLLLSSLSSANTLNDSSADFDWSDYTTLLKQNIKQVESSDIRTNLVNYQAISEDPKYSALFERLASYNPSSLKGKDKIAFYINIYNLFAIKLVTDHMPKKSIRDIGTWFSPVWQKPAAVLASKAISLDTIEHKILRRMNEPRIHFAIVCASLSCPDLRTEAYSANKLNEQLDEQARNFLANSGKGIKIEGGKIYLSKIFSWFAEDFAKDEKPISILKFIAQYNIEAGRFSEYETLDYNWQLNRQ
jgi:hypothetical protein